MGRTILHAFMRRGWKKSSVMRLSWYLAHGLITLGIAFLALMSDSADPLLLSSALISIGIIATQTLGEPLLEAVDRPDDPLIPRIGWFTRACGIALAGMVLSLFFHQPAALRSAGIPPWSLALANVAFLAALLLATVTYLVTAAPPLGHQAAPAGS
jgi:hypothetical protein